MEFIYMKFESNYLGTVRKEVVTPVGRHPKDERKH